jgi:hypothetical protein
VSTPLPVITDGFRLAHEYHSSDATFVNVFWLLAGGSATPADVGAVFIAAYATIGSSFSMKSLHSSDITFDKCVVTPLDGVTPSVEVPYSSGVHGGGVAGAVAANSAFIITWLTGERGRNHRGRSFLGGCPSASLEVGGARWGSSIIADALDAAGGFTSGLLAGTPSLDLLVVSQHSVAGPGHLTVSDWTPRAGVGTQRGRTERAHP